MCARRHRKRKRVAPDEPPGSSNIPAVVDASPLIEFRRTERVAFETPVDVYVGGDGQAAIEHAKTLNVSANGALLVLAISAESGQQLILINPKTKKEIQCVVRRVIRPYAGTTGTQIGVEFVTFSPDFWGIDSPPADWDPNWVPPEERPSLDIPPQKEAPPPPPVPKLAAQLSKPAAPTRLNKLVKEITEDLGKPDAADTVAVTPKRSWAFKWLILPAAAATLFALWMTMRKSGDAGPAVKQSSSLTSVSPEDARLIPNIERLKLAAAEDFDPRAVSWLRDSGQQVGGKIPGAYFGSSESNAYVMVEKTNERRVVILAAGELHYNAEYPVIAIAARIPKELVAKISWADSSPPDSDRDGLLIVRAADSPASAVVLFLKGNEVVSATPSDYRQIPFNQPR